MEEVIGLQEAKELLRQAATCARAGQTTRLLLHGVPGVGKSFLAQSFAKSMGWTVERILLPNFCVSAEPASQAESAAREPLVALQKGLERLATGGRPAVLLLDELECLDPSYAGAAYGQVAADVREQLAAELVLQLPKLADEPCGGVVVVGGTQQPWGVRPSLLQCFDACVHLPLPSADERLQLIERELRTMLQSCKPDDPAELDRTVAGIAVPHVASCAGCTVAEIVGLCGGVAKQIVKSQIVKSLADSGAGDGPAVGKRQAELAQAVQLAQQRWTVQLSVRPEEAER